MFKKFYAFKFISVIFVTVLGLSTLGYLLLLGYWANEDRLVSEFRDHVMNEDFKNMYADSSDYMKLSVSEEEFVRRMRAVTDALRANDPNFNFRRLTKLENIFKENPKAGEAPNYSFVFLETGSADKNATIHISWFRTGIKPKLFDVSIGVPIKISPTNRINSLAGEPFLAGE